MMVSVASHHQDGDPKQTLMIDSATSHSILRERHHFTHLQYVKDESITTITGTTKFSHYIGDASVTLANGTSLHLRQAIWAPTATRNLSSFRDVLANDYHISTAKVEDKDVLHIVDKSNKIMETFVAHHQDMFTLPFDKCVLEIHAAAVNPVNL